MLGSGVASERLCSNYSRSRDDKGRGFGGLVFFAFSQGATDKPFPAAVFVLLMLVFGGAGAFLVFASQT